MFDTVRPAIGSRRTATLGAMRQVASGSIVWRGALWGGWLGLFPFVDYAFGPRTNSLSALAFDAQRDPSPAQSIGVLLILLIGAAPAVLSSLRWGVDFRRARSLGWALLPQALVIPLSLFAASDTAVIFHVILVYYAFVLMIVFVSLRTDSDELLRGAFAGVAMTHALALLIMLSHPDYAWGRLIGVAGPNYWGMVSMTLVFASFAFRRRQITIPLMALGVVVMFLGQARGSMFGTAIGMACVGMIVLAKRRVIERTWLALALVVAGVATLTFGYQVLADKVLLLSAPGRGLGSGGSGRTAAWAQAYQLFAAHPWLGVGYRQHERYLTAASSAHNGYLATLAETGILGILAYLLFLVGAFGRAIVQARKQQTPVRLAAVGFLAAFLAVSVFERRALNTGNTLSMLMLLVAAWSWRAPGSGAEEPKANAKPT